MSSLFFIAKYKDRRVAIKRNPDFMVSLRFSIYPLSLIVNCMFTLGHDCFGS